MKSYTCIICPNSCEIEIELIGKEIKFIKKGLCPKGEIFVKNEITNPLRSLCTLVYVENGEIPLLSVKTTKPIPKDKIFNAMDIIKKINVKAPIKIGDIIYKNILNLDCDLVATKEIKEIKEIN